MRQAAGREGAERKRPAKREGQAAGTKRAELTMAIGAKLAAVREATGRGLKRADY
jgi:hypothetical protein